MIKIQGFAILWMILDVLLLAVCTYIVYLIVRYVKRKNKE